MRRADHLIDLSTLDVMAIRIQILRNQSAQPPLPTPSSSRFPPPREPSSLSTLNAVQCTVYVLVHAVTKPVAHDAGVYARLHFRTSINVIY
ncbi:unnamed protein product [Danaus chrysippus]|uniref:(African queen) hypothetical protein n=1 Tax=Danaus chrysippus TaxID=151541 RepID=A0A8J2VQN6_9NEOP|nr:unnamed protein product [Danaus chrysippus]